MAKITCSSFLVMLLLIGGIRTPVQAVTIYRLGGENLPLPAEVERGDAEYRQLSWTDIDAKLQGVSESMILGTDGIYPLFFGPEENIANSVFVRGGYLQTQGFQGWIEADDISFVNDGLPETFYYGAKGSDRLDVGDDLRLGKTFLFDLGGLFAVDQVRFHTRADNQDRYIETFQVWANTLSNAEQGISFNDLCTTTGAGHLGACVGLVNKAHRDLFFRKDLLFEVLQVVRENTKASVEIMLPGEYIRRLALFVPSQKRDWEIAELEIFAPGYVPNANYLSNIIDLGEEVVLGQMRWSGYKDKGATVDIRIQSGSDSEPNIYWRNTFRGEEQVTYDAAGAPLNFRTYKKLEFSERGKVTRDAENWDFWSASFDFSDSLGAPIITPRPRRYVQLEVDFQSSVDAGSQLDYVEFVTSPPAASALVGEVDPWQVATAELTQFTYAVRPIIDLGDPGFDHLEIRVNGGRLVRIEEVRIGGTQVAFTRIEEREDRLVVGLPKIDVTRTQEVIEVVFSGEIFRFGATFTGHVFNSETPLDIHQPIQAGNATSLLDGNTLTVQATSLNSKILGEIVLGQDVFTPNGDGINDHLTISYELFKLVTPTSVKVSVGDMSGLLIQQIYQGFDAAGRHVLEWDGLDDNGQPVSPGLYIFRIEVDTEEGKQQGAAVVGVAY